ncbi:DNA recombination protein RmuC [Gillisia sp. Q332]|uniref:DNA recombination protein RmuC n=1 Tax=Gillisia xinjiangensis TaxID=3384765 RepID=UPI00391CD85E
MDIYMLITVAVLVLISIILIFVFRPKTESNGEKNYQLLQDKLDDLFFTVEKLQGGLKEDFRINREESAKLSKEDREELNDTLKDIQKDQKENLKTISEDNVKAFDKLTEKLEEKLTALTNKADENAKENRDETKTSFKEFQESFAQKIKEFNDVQKEKFKDINTKQKELVDTTETKLESIRKTLEEKLKEVNDQSKEDSELQRTNLTKEIKAFQEAFDKSVQSFNDLQREKFADLDKKQDKLIEGTEKKLEEMRETVDEKLQKTLNERLGQSFETVGKQLEAVQLGLGEMKNLATDVGGLKKVLSNVKMRGGFGEVQLGMLLEQILAPDQYEANVKTKSGSSDSVEYAIKLPGKDENGGQVWLPVDAKFPKDIYEQLQNAHEIGDIARIKLADKNLESTIKKMAKDISEKYLDPPNTTDFGIMFLPFEGIYAEVVRNASLLETLQRDYKIIVTGPTTLAAILNSLQMGFKTLAIQKRSSEVWQVLGAVKTEFKKFGGLMDKAQKNIQIGLNQLEEVQGKRTKAIQRKLISVESLDPKGTSKIFPQLNKIESLEDRDNLEPDEVQQN